MDNLNVINNQKSFIKDANETKDDFIEIDQQQFDKLNTTVQQINFIKNTNEKKDDFIEIDQQQSDKLNELNNKKELMKKDIEINKQQSDKLNILVQQISLMKQTNENQLLRLSQLEKIIFSKNQSKDSIINIEDNKKNEEESNNLN